LVRTSAGNVGIGTATANQRLVVDGDTRTTKLMLANGQASGHTPGTTPTIYSPAEATTALSQGGQEVARADADGRILLGASSSAVASRLVVQGNSGSTLSLLHMLRDVDTSAISSGNIGLGSMAFGTRDGAIGAQFSAVSDGTWSASSRPASLNFYTTPSGSTSLVERMRIDSQGDVIFQGAPIIKSPDGKHWAIEVDNNGNLSAFLAI
jgi:hypothetical protein